MSKFIVPQFCPECASTEVESLAPWDKNAAFCHQCDYRGCAEYFLPGIAMKRVGVRLQATERALDRERKRSRLWKLAAKRRLHLGSRDAAILFRSTPSSDKVRIEWAAEEPKQDSPPSHVLLFLAAALHFLANKPLLAKVIEDIYGE